MNNRFIDLSGRVAIVTGAGAGLGRGIALELARNGADVVIADVDVAAAGRVAKEVEAEGRSALAVSADVSEQTSADSVASKTMSTFGRIDILVNNAGIGGAPGWADRFQGSPEDWDAVFAVNVFGIVKMCQAVTPHMVERRSGKVVNIASAAGRLGSPGFAHYAASKASVINVSQAWAYKLAPYNINVNSVCPGVIWTALWEDLAKRRLGAEGDTSTPGREFFDRRIAGNIPLRREQTPEDIGMAVAFLVSDRARNITGQALNVDGGSRMN